jgi:8-oxo-dGTP pyrophosphatase MutT (NUDIX family)
VLLVTSSRRPDNWIVPGGGVEPEEEPSVTAMREVLEEAGVIGKLGRCLGVFEVISTNTYITLTIYAFTIFRHVLILISLKRPLKLTSTFEIITIGCHKKMIQN